MNKDVKIMMIDDDEKALRSLSVLLRTQGFNLPLIVDDPENALAAIAENLPDIVLLDLHMPKVSGISLLEQIKKDHPEIIVIIITADIQVDIAVKCTQLGAYDYFIKPIDHQRLIQIMLKSLETKRLSEELITIQRRLLRGSEVTHSAFSSILTKNEGMKQLFKYIEAISGSSRPVLIRGETGTGKELFARSVHEVTETQGEMVTVNVAGLDDTAFSDSLFGHKKGAYTGAHANRDGLIKRAHQGTLFLDEVGDLKSQSQIKLLRLLQENNYYPLGSDQLSTNTARIVTATNQNLEKMIEDGEFRRDLFYRLHIHTITIPPLRERREDIPLLTEFFVEKACKDLNKEIPQIPDSLYEVFSTYQFLGNVRELEILLYDASVHTTGDTLNIQYIEKHIGEAKNKNVKGNSETTEGSNDIWSCFSNMPDLPTIKDATECLIDEALSRSNNNQKEASVILGITRQALNKRLTRRVE